MATFIRNVPPQSLWPEHGVLNTPDTVAELVSLIGKRFVAYICSENDGRIVDRWSSGVCRPSYDSEHRLRLARKVCRIVRNRFDEATVQGWIRGMNPDLDDRVALVMLREEQDLTKLDRQLTTAAEHFAEL